MLSLLLAGQMVIQRLSSRADIKMAFGRTWPPCFWAMLAEQLFRAEMIIDHPYHQAGLVADKKLLSLIMDG